MRNPTERTAYYRARAADIRNFAESELTESLRHRLLEIARQYDEQAADLENDTVAQAA
jgi:hypothetical protein